MTIEVSLGASGLQTLELKALEKDKDKEASNFKKKKLALKKSFDTARPLIRRLSLESMSRNPKSMNRRRKLITCTPF